MNLGRTLGQKILRQQLARERRRFRGQALLLGGDFSWHIARGGMAALDVFQRLAVGAIEQKYEALLAGLRDGVDFFPVAIHGQQDRGRGKNRGPRGRASRLENARCAHLVSAFKARRVLANKSSPMRSAP